MYHRPRRPTDCSADRSIPAGAPSYAGSVPAGRPVLRRTAGHSAGIPVYTPAQGDPLPAAELRAAIRCVGRVVAFASHEPVRELLAELHAGLVEWVHVVETTAVDGGDLEHHDQLADRVRVRARERDRHVHAAV